MGTIEAQSGKAEKVNRNFFEFKYVIGRGGFGKVWKVAYKKTNTFYALKEMSKVRIIDRKSEKSIISERTILSKLRHPFLINMIYCFQDNDYWYLVMDLLTGGDLRYHICRHLRFSEIQTKFFLACWILGLEYIHQHRILHRDIKPENLVCDYKGYIRITDFGVAKQFHRNNSEETSGTPGYMAPEVLCAQNHGYPVDYFALGVLGYEFMLGTRPYWGKSRKEIKQAVLAKQVQVRSHEIPIGWSYDASDFINRLLQRKVSYRLGYNGIEEIKHHPWFNNFNWDDLLKKTMPSPFTPRNGDNYDKRYCEGEDKIGNDTEERYKIYKKHEEYANAFINYTYNNITPEDIQKISWMSQPTGTSITTNCSERKTSSSTKASSTRLNQMIQLHNINNSTSKGNFHISNNNSGQNTAENRTNYFMLKSNIKQGDLKLSKSPTDSKVIKYDLYSSNKLVNNQSYNHIKREEQLPKINNNDIKWKHSSSTSMLSSRQASWNLNRINHGKIVLRDLNWLSPNRTAWKYIFPMRHLNISNRNTLNMSNNINIKGLSKRSGSTINFVKNAYNNANFLGKA